MTSLTQDPCLLPYTPLVLPYTNCLGAMRRRKARTNASVRKSRHHCSLASSGGARWTTRCAKPANRAKECARSRSPHRTRTPNCLMLSALVALRQSTITCSLCLLVCMRLNSRIPISPHPTMRMRWRRKRAGKAPEAGWEQCMAATNKPVTKYTRLLQGLKPILWKLSQHTATRIAP